MGNAGPDEPLRPQQHFPTLHSAEHASLIDVSHRRSTAFGLREHEAPDFSGMDAAAMRQVLEENRFLYRHAAPVMETLYHQIANTQSMVLLTTRSGTVLHSLGDADFLERAAQVALRPGVDWSERSKGTNAIGTALAEGHPLVVHGDQHYLRANRFLTCSCTPIFDPYGKVIGALDVTGDHRSYHQHTMALARMSAQMIENQMFAGVFEKEVLLRFHARPEFLGTLIEGIAVFTPEGRFVTANRSAQFQLERTIQALETHTFSSLFGISIGQLLDQLRSSGGQPVGLCLHNGVKVFGNSTLARRSFTPPEADAGGPVPSSAAAGHAGHAGYAGHAGTAGNAGAAPVGPRKDFLSGLRYLDTGDAQVHAVIEKLTLVRGRDIPIMILGETGTGKDLLAQAIHHDSPRAQRGFVSINCASIPETLIESELFGYDEGAFTGAKRKGSVGKILAANGGTLFLDEIGDMPKHLQARLLRVLQERKVSPLGGGKEVDVDIAVICATHRNLREMIARGEFREDLYYRLNGLVLRLPPLRDRTDTAAVIEKILSNVSHSVTPMRISAEVMQCFVRYHWPGNFRQLHNVVRTAAVMAEYDGTIDWQHLPDDFMEEIGRACRAGTAAPPAAMGAAGLGTVAVGNRPPEPDVSDPAYLLENVALDAMAQALRNTGGNITEAARLLGVSRNTIYRKKNQLPKDVWGP